jgi:hypothetical protein
MLVDQMSEFVSQQSSVHLFQGSIPTHSSVIIRQGCADNWFSAIQRRVRVSSVVALLLHRLVAISMWMVRPGRPL